MPDNVNITVNETIENVVINPSISTDVIDFNITATTENVTIDVTPNLTTVNINSISGSPVTKTSDLTNDGEDGIHPFITIEDVPAGGLTSVGLTMPVAFSVANSPLTSDGTIAVTAAGTSSQYIRGDGQLATLPSGGGGGSSVNYYLNGSIAASVATYKQLSNTAIIGGGTDFAITGNGLISQFLTDVGNPNRLQIPSGAWNFEMFFSMSSSGGTPKFYVELLKYNGTTFTTIANNSAVPETINGGTSIDLYLTSLAVPETTLLLTDRLAIRVYIVNSTGGRTATLHTENSHLCQIITTFASGISAINGLNSNNQYLAVGTTGTDFNISSVSETHTFNLPTASATNRGALSTTDWTAFNGKFTLPALTSGSVLFSNGTTIAQDNSNFFWDDTNNRLGIGTASPTKLLHVNGSSLVTVGASTVNTTLFSVDITQTNSIAPSGVTPIGISVNGIYTDTNTNNNTIFGPFLSVTPTIAHTLSTLSGAEKNFINFSPIFSGAGKDINQSNYIVRISPSFTNRHINNITGLYYNPTFTLTGSNNNHRAIETVSGNVLFNTTSGNTLIGTTTDNGGKLQIKAGGALSTDIALRVRDSADSADLATIDGLGNASLNTLTVRGTGTGIGILFGVSGASGRITVDGSFSRWKSPSQIDMINVANNFVGINSTSVIASAVLAVDSTTKGFLPPRMTNAQRIAIATPAVGLMVYCTDATEGLYINKSTGWTYIG